MDNKEKLRDKLRQDLYQEMCNGCTKEKYCHEECENCDDYLEAEEKLFKKHHCEELYLSYKEWQKQNESEGR